MKDREFRMAFMEGCADAISAAAGEEIGRRVFTDAERPDARGDRARDRLERRSA